MSDEKIRILVIEDEPTITEFLRVGFGYEGYEVAIAEDGRTGLQMAEQGDYGVIILDIMLPDMDGFTVCRKLRARGNNTPIIMLTALTELSDRVTGLDSGADDYVTKPFMFEELLARVRVQLRHRGKLPTQTELRAGDLVLNPDTHEVFKGKKPLHLTPTEFKMLHLLMSHPRRVFSKETLLNRVWGYDYVGDTNIVEVHISHLRDKIGDKPPRLIQTVYGVGYAFHPEEASDAPVE
ncbi:MAG TPA: response regulator transcription factor [Chloroflexi bacterium]|nr:response regulator transcription factor [Chloroflexota bacterium]